MFSVLAIFLNNVQITLSMKQILASPILKKQVFKPLQVKKTSWHNVCAGQIADGCQSCVLGQKLVIFITGLCGQHCWYCPVSDQKMRKDVIYANERPVHSEADLIQEAEESGAMGAGITGGDPLVKVERCAHYTWLLKEHFGKDFHVHLYTPLQLVNEERLRILYESGLDEIRFHPYLDDKTWWPRIELARKFPWKVGVEIPAIPGEEKAISELIYYIKDKVDFLNLNELEVSDNLAWQEAFKTKHIKCKDNSSYGVTGSEQTAMNLIKLTAKLGLRTHFCTSKSKDAIQHGNRVKRRAERMKKPYDLVDDEGMLTRGAIYTDLVPCTNYYGILKHMPSEEKQSRLLKLSKLKQSLQKKFNIPNDLIEVDPQKLRILTGGWIVQEIHKKIKNKSAIVTEYPTWDHLEVEVGFLK